MRGDAAGISKQHMDLTAFFPIPSASVPELQQDFPMSVARAFKPVISLLENTVIG